MLETPRNGNEPANLAELVQRFRVCWKAWPEYTYVRGERRQIGYELELAGTHEQGACHLEPGCDQCQQTYVALRRIAEHLLPRDDRASTYEIEPFDQAIYFRGLHSNRPDVMLTVKIFHRHGYDRPVDNCEERCLREMEQRLRELGAGHLAWTGHKDEATEKVNHGCPPEARPPRTAN